MACDTSPPFARRSGPGRCGHTGSGALIGRKGSDPMTDCRRTAAASEAESPLARLGAHLAAHRFEVDLTADGLAVYSPDTEPHGAGSNPSERSAIDTITCRPHEADDGRLWFFSSDGKPIDEADHIVDTVVAIKGRLAGVS